MSGGKEQLPLDAKLLSLAIIELNISRRNVAIYPENHPSIVQSINKAFSHLQSLFEIRSEITLAVARNILVIDDFFLDKNNPVYRDFAEALFSMGIASITFIQGISEEEIRRFHRVLIMDPDLISEKGGILSLVSELGITHICPQLIDYSAFRFSEAENRATDDINIWEEYTFGLLQGTLSGDEAAERIKDIPPGELSQIVNRTMEENAGKETYDHVISAYLKTTAEEKQLKKGSLGDISVFINGLKPSLKKQFLSGTFRFISPDPILAQKLSEGLTGDQLMDLLNEINERDEIVPETLRNLLEKFASMRQKEFSIDAKLIPSGDSVIDDIQLSPEVINLFEKDKYNEFVSEEYRNELQMIMQQDFGKEESTVTGNVQKECEDEHLDVYVTDTCLELLNGEGLLSKEEIERISDHLKRNTLNFVETGQFQGLSRIYDEMGACSSVPQYRDMAEQMLGYITSEEFVEHLLSFFRFWGRKNREEAIGLSQRLRKVLSAPLFLALMEEENSSVRGFYLAVLSSFGEEVLPLALEYLNDERWYVKRNMIILLRECGDRRVLKNIKQLCEARDFRVALEAVKAYMHFGDNDGLRYMKHYLLSKNLDIRDQILKLSGIYKVKLLVPDIIKLFISKDIIGGDFHLKIPIVKALGDIGDERALPYLLEFCRSKSLLYKNTHDLLKVEIFRSLLKYPRGEMMPFIEAGMKSKNKEIDELCTKIMRREEQGGEE